MYRCRNELPWQWESRYQPEYGCLRDEVLNALDAYLDCGLLLHGCARARCERCNHSRLIAFSCKKRGICPSCAAKRAIIFAEHLCASVLKPVPHRHMVFSLPKRLRPFFKYDRKQCALLFDAAWTTIKELYAAVLPAGDPGAIIALQTAGDSLNFNPHLHAIVSDGVFDAAGNCHRLPAFSAEAFTKIFAHKVLTAMRNARLIDQSVIDNILSWQHSGFSVWAGEPIAHDNADSIQFLARYIDRGPVANSRIEITDDILSYLTADSVTHEFSPLDFLARLTPHIPRKWESTVRYFGEYSHRRRGERKKLLATGSNAANATPLPPPDNDKPKPSRTWAALIKKIYEVDPLVCDKCGGTMKVIAFLQDPAEIKKITTALHLPDFHPPPPFPPAPQQFKFDSA